jgi:DNA invertase Pin-like site-specific DNA recombinase
MLYSTHAMLDLLRSTLDHLEEETQDIDPNDPTLIEFKASILGSIAELELTQPRAA